MIDTLPAAAQALREALTAVGAVELGPGSLAERWRSEPRRDPLLPTRIGHMQDVVTKGPDGTGTCALGWSSRS